MWKYLVVSINLEENNLQTRLNYYGSESWELVQLQYQELMGTIYANCIFKKSAMELGIYIDTSDSTVSGIKEYEIYTQEG